MHLPVFLVGSVVAFALAMLLREAFQLPVLVFWATCFVLGVLVTSVLLAIVD